MSKDPNEYFSALEARRAKAVRAAKYMWIREAAQIGGGCLVALLAVAALFAFMGGSLYAIVRIIRMAWGN